MAFFNPLFSRSSQVRGVCPMGDLQSLCDLCGVRLATCSIIRPFLPGVPSSTTWGQGRSSPGGDSADPHGCGRLLCSTVILGYRYTCCQIKLFMNDGVTGNPMKSKHLQEFAVWPWTSGQTRYTLPDSLVSSHYASNEKPAVHPPSTTRIWPVTYLASSEAR